eukprot:8748494-Pyramimonas_sp.AAC.1
MAQEIQRQIQEARPLHARQHSISARSIVISIGRSIVIPNAMYIVSSIVRSIAGSIVGTIVRSSVRSIGRNRSSDID